MTDEEYYNFTQPYQNASEILLSKMKSLNHSLYRTLDQQPIHYVEQRIKGKASIENKLIKKGYEPTVDNAKDHLQDIAGIRIICYFIDDIFNMVSAIKRQEDLILIREKDYITQPKVNGYRSYHMIMGVPVYCYDGMEYFPVEIQIRTMSMDFWASMEHRIAYKAGGEKTEGLTEELRHYADMLVQIEDRFEAHSDVERLAETAEING
jgi:putative GTP pyrophosphokinase